MFEKYPLLWAWGRPEGARRALLDAAPGVFFQMILKWDPFINIFGKRPIIFFKISISMLSNNHLFERSFVNMESFAFWYIAEIWWGGHGLPTAWLWPWLGPSHVKNSEFSKIWQQKIRGLGMGFSIVEFLSGLRGNSFSLFRSLQHNPRKKKVWWCSQFPVFSLQAPGPPPLAYRHA